MANAYRRRAKRARVVNDLDRETANLELALPAYREAARIYSRAEGNYANDADIATRKAIEIEEELRQCTIAKTTAAAAAAARAASSAVESTSSAAVLRG